MPHVVSLLWDTSLPAKRRGETRGNELWNAFPGESSSCTASLMAGSSSRAHLKPLLFAPWKGHCLRGVPASRSRANPGWDSRSPIETNLRDLENGGQNLNICFGHGQNKGTRCRVANLGNPWPKR